MAKEEKKKTTVDSQQEIERLKKDIEAYKEAGVKMGEEITTLKKQLSGYKGRCSQLTKDVERFKALDKEGDELNEKRITELETKETVIRGLQNQVQEVSKQFEKTNKLLASTREERDVYLELINKVIAMPWYKRMFWKGQ